MQSIKHARRGKLLLQADTDLLDEGEELAEVVRVVLIQGADLADVLVLGLIPLEILWRQ